MNNSSNANCDSDERVDLPSGCFECLDEWVVFRGFSLCALLGNMSWQYATSMNCMIFGVVAIMGASFWYGRLVHIVCFGLSLAKHVQGVVGHVH